MGVDQLKKTSRRMGPAGSDVWHKILDGAEELLRDEGYAALTSRNIAGRIDIKQQLIYYYFQTMDDLVVALFERAAQREYDRLVKAVDSANPLRSIWESCRDMQDNKLVSEFTALANRNPYLRKEVIAFIENIRQTHIGLLRQAIANNSSMPSCFSAEALALIAYGLGMAVARYGELGIVTGHPEVDRLMATFFDLLEGEVS